MCFLIAIINWKPNDVPSLLIVEPLYAAWKLYILTQRLMYVNGKKYHIIYNMNKDQTGWYCIT